MAMINKLKENVLLVIFLAAATGVTAGICGAVISQVYLLSDYSSPYFNQDVNLTDLNANNRSNLVIRDPKTVVVNQDLKVSETINSLSSSLVKIYKIIIPKVGAASSSPEYYPLDKPLFMGLVITSDGWIMSSLPLEFKDAFSTADYVALTSDRKIYKIDKISILKNLPGDVIFYHLASASNLAVRKIVDRSELSLGQSLIVIDNFNNVWPTTLSSFKKTPAVLNSDSLNARLSLANNSEAVQKNSFVFNLSGDLTAVISASQEIVPAFTYASYWQSFWKNESTLRPTLGVNYLDLSLVRIPSLNLDKGALIYPGIDKVAVMKNSPAYLAGLMSGDIITWVDNQEINSTNDLADLITKYKPGDKIGLTYMRDGQEGEFDIKLGELK